jgi:hypothetical protein
MPISRRPFAAVVIALLAACNSASEPSPTAAGDYVLQTIDGHRLPATGGADFVVSSSISLHSDGQFTFARIDSFPSRSGSPKDTIALSGTWSVSGADIHMVFGQQKLFEQWFGTLSGAQLTVVQPLNGTWVFARH